MIDKIMDFEISEDERISNLNQYYKENGEECIEVLHKIIGMYSMSGITFLRKFLVKISLESRIPIELKCLCCNALFGFSEYREKIEDDDDEDLKIAKKDSNEKLTSRNKERVNIAYEILNYICMIEKNEESLPIPRKIEMIFRLMESSKYRNDCVLYFIKFLENSNVDSLYKYKTILSIEYNTRIRNTCKEYFMRSLMMEFIKMEGILIYYKIIACQYILKKGLGYGNTEKSVFEYLVMFMTDTDLDYNRRSDAADVLLQYGNDEFRELARNTLFFLGSENKSTTIYDNKQNVHLEEIEESIIGILEKLHTTPLLRVDGREINLKEGISQFWEFIRENEMLVDSKVEEQIKQAFDRIELDNTSYSRFNMKLSRVYLLVWSYIYEHEYSRELKIRLYEELVEMSSTCSTGFISRLANVVSGFDEMNLGISFKQQVISNFKGRLQRMIREIGESESPFYRNKIIMRDIVKLNIWEEDGKLTSEDIDDIVSMGKGGKLVIYMSRFQENVLTELMIDTEKFSERMNFSLFLKVVVQDVYKELYDEFREYISQDDFELYFREALFTFEGCHV